MSAQSLQRRAAPQHQPGAQPGKALPESRQRQPQPKLGSRPQRLGLRIKDEYRHQGTPAATAADSIG